VIMRAKIDNTIEFELLKLKAGSWKRDSVEKSAAGLDGVVSIDLGRRKRKIKLFGIIESQSKGGLEKKKELINALLDGKVHMFEADTEYKNIRIDLFEVVKDDHSGKGISCEFELGLSQLRVN
jgi:hypothetical protein